MSQSATAIASASAAKSELETSTISAISWRLIPFLVLAYFLAYLDRVNLGFAALTMNAELKFSPTVFAWGAGIFFIGYFIFEVPSNLILQRVGARIWIARIMIVWGVVSMAMMFIHSTTMFYVMRFLLGVAEAGFFPGVVLYLTCWYPHRERAGTIALFALGGVLAGWQWLFLLEAIPAVLMGGVVLVLLPNRPSDARWLSAPEKVWVQARLDADAAQMLTHQHHRLGEAFTSGRVWLFCLLYFLMNVGSYGYELWLPTIIKSFSGQSDAIVGWINGVPYLIAGLVMILAGRHSDRIGERRWHVAIAAVASAVGFALSAWFTNPYLALAALALAFAGNKSTIAPLWALATAFLAGPAAAGGIALINSVGNLGGFFGPYIVGVIKDRTHSNLAALLFLGAALLLMALCTLMIRPVKARVD